MLPRLALSTRPCLQGVAKPKKVKVCFRWPCGATNWGMWKVGTTHTSAGAASSLSGIQPRQLVPKGGKLDGLPRLQHFGKSGLTLPQNPNHGINVLTTGPKRQKKVPEKNDPFWSRG